MRGPERKTTKEQDEIIVKKGREKFCAPVRAVLVELNSPIKKKISRQTADRQKKISRQTADRRLQEAGVRTVKADMWMWLCGTR